MNENHVYGVYFYKRLKKMLYNVSQQFQTNGSLPLSYTCGSGHLEFDDNFLHNFDIVNLTTKSDAYRTLSVQPYIEDFTANEEG